MKANKKRHGIKQKIREERKREERIGFAIFIAVLVIIIFISGFLVNSLLNQPSISQTAISTSAEPKAAIVDHLSLTYPNQTFIETATNTLKQVGYTVDYYPGDQVTVEFYRNLPTHDYSLIILRVHSTATGVQGTNPVALFTSESYSQTKYVYEQLTEQLVEVAFSPQEWLKGINYFGIGPLFVTQSMKEKFDGTIIIIMGCEGLSNTKMAEAFIEKGAKVCISWNKPVLATRTDQATTHLLRHFFTEKQTITEAVTETNREVGPDPSHDSLLLYYPPEAGSYTIQNIVDYQTTSSVGIQLKTLSEKRKISN